MSPNRSPRSSAHKARNDLFRNSRGTLGEIRASRAPTADTVTKECQKLGVQHRVEDVPESQGAKLHWIGDSSLKDVMVYFHGGGYGLQPHPGHIIFLVQSQRKMAEENKPFAVAFLEYGLSPTHKFPTQIMQGVQAVNHVLTTRSPSNVILAGDSAGGHLALGVLSATQHTHPLIPPLPLASPLKSTILISPWSSLSTTANSYTTNASTDIFPLSTVLALRHDFIPSYPTASPFADPLLADPKWWTNLPVNSILNLAGTHEVFFDDIVALGNRMAEAGVNVTTVECERQVHIDCILDAQMGMETGRMSWEVWGWLGKVLGEGERERENEGGGGGEDPGKRRANL